MARVHSSINEIIVAGNPDSSNPSAGPSAIDILTGVAYADRAQTLLHNRKVHTCPFRTFMPNTDDNIDCPFVFSRAYDLKRHLKSSHDIELSREDADRWVGNAQNFL